MIRGLGLFLPAGGMLLLAAAILAATADAPYFLNLATIIGINVLLSLGLGVLSGLTGQISMGHGALFGIGAYAMGYGVTALGIGFWPAMLLAVAMTAACGAVMGVISLRFAGIYFAIVTFAFSAVLLSTLENWRSVTGGANGLSTSFDPPPLQLGSFQQGFDAPPAFFALVAVSVVLAILVVTLIVHSRFGRACIAIREDEVLARCLGISAFGTKLAAFAVSSAFAGMAGAWYATYLKFISPEIFTVNVSIEMLMALIIGGLLNPIAGPLIGSALLVILPELLRFAEGYRTMMFGALAIAIIVLMPQGIAGMASSLRARLPWRAAAGEPRAS